MKERDLPPVTARLAIIRKALLEHAVPALDALDSRLRHEVVADLTVNPPSEALAAGVMRVHVVSHRVPPVADVQAAARPRSFSDAMRAEFGAKDEAVIPKTSHVAFAEAEYVERWVVRHDGRSLFHLPTRRMTDGTYRVRVKHGRGVQLDLTTRAFDDKGDADDFAAEVRSRAQSGATK